MGWVLGAPLCCYSMARVSFCPSWFGANAPILSCTSLFIIKLVKTLFHVPLGLGHESVCGSGEVLNITGVTGGPPARPPPEVWTGVCFAHPPRPEPNTTRLKDFIWLYLVKC